MITVFTPCHKLDFDCLSDAFASLQNQNFEHEFEWLLLLNGEAILNDSLLDLLKKVLASNQNKKLTVTLICSEEKNNSIGYWKSQCVSKSKHGIVLELDYDDYLHTEALQHVYNVFLDQDVQFVYSDDVYFDKNDPKRDFSYGKEFGWKQGFYNDNPYNISFPIGPQYLRRIEWSPDHLRAFRKGAYYAIGGYNEDLIVGDDHDLMCRFYIHYGSEGFAKAGNYPLYFYRVHSSNTSNGSNKNHLVQEQTNINYHKYLVDMFKTWSRENNLLMLDCGGRFDCPKDFISLDLRDADIVMDLSKPWKIQDNSVGILRAYHVLEHIRDTFKVGEDGELELVRNGTIHFFNEAFRVLAPGGLLLFEVPSINGTGSL